MKPSIANLFQLLFPLQVCSLYLPPVFYTLFTACLFILALFAITRGYQVNFRQALPWLFVGFFLVHLIGLFHTDNPGEVWKATQNKLSFAVLPFILLVFQPLLTRSFFRKLIATFFWSTLIISVILLSVSGLNLFENYKLLATQNRTDDLQILRHFYASILTHGYIHRSYLGLLIGAALFSSPFVFPVKPLKRVLFVVALSVLALVLFLLQSRMILVAFVLSAFLYLIIQILKTRSIKWFSALVGSIISLSIIGYFFADSPYNRFQNVQLNDYNLSDDKSEFTGSTIRFAIWENSLDLIKENPFFGVGYGELREERLEVYRKNGFEIGLDEEFNSHNQILETQVATGIPGSIFLISMFVWIAVIAIKRQDTHLLILSTFLFLSMLTEAMFERQLAIAFFCTYILALALGEKVAFKKKEPA